MNYYLGIDVGTGSARAGLFDVNGRLHGHHTEAIQLWRPEADFVEQSSEDIWAAVCSCTQRVVSDAGIETSAILGIGFDATCSLVLLDASGAPVSVDPDGEDSRISLSGWITVPWRKPNL